MAIRTVVTRGFGNGTFSGSIGDGGVSLRGYYVGSVATSIGNPRFSLGQVFVPGLKASLTRVTPPMRASEVYFPGMKKGSSG